MNYQSILILGDQSSLSKRNKTKLREVLAQVEDFYKDNNQKSIKIEVESNTLKLEIYNEVRNKFPGVNTEYSKSKPIMTFRKSKKFTIETDKNEDIKEEDENSLSQYINQTFEREMGFSLVIDEMIKAQKPLIGHNFIYDVGFLYDQFIAPLPDTFLEFSEKWRECFPLMFDTKTIALKSELKLFRRTDLESLYLICRKDETLLSELKYHIDQDIRFSKYHNSEDYFKGKYF